jgi:nitrogen regulatory protein P-II 1
MRIGIVTDIHDQVDLLAQALAALRAEAVDAIVTLGDNTDLFGKWNAAREVAALLREAGVVGVWGNHDYGLCRNLTEEIRFRFLSPTCDYFASLHPRLELGGCHFTHVEPFLDPERPEHLWTFEGRPEDEDRAELRRVPASRSLHRPFPPLARAHRNRARRVGRHRAAALRAGEAVSCGGGPALPRGVRRHRHGPLGARTAEPAPARGPVPMKLILAIIQPSKLDAVKEALNKVEVFRLTIVDVLGFGRQKGHTEVYRGHELTVNMLRKVQLQIAVNEDFVEPTVNAIMDAARTGPEGRIGDGKIFILPLEDCIRIRTGERGPEAI